MVTKLTPVKGKIIPKKLVKKSVPKKKNSAPVKGKIPANINNLQKAIMGSKGIC